MGCVACNDGKSATLTGSHRLLNRGNTKRLEMVARSIGAGPFWAHG